MTTITLALMTGTVVLLAGGLPWGGFLAPANLRIGVVVPWAILPMSIYLLCYWKFIGGRWGSKSSAGMRRANLRANPLPAELWSASLAAGLLGFAALVALIMLMGRLVNLPASGALTTPAGMPLMTTVALLVMASIVAGVTEEAAFRGYMQGPIERQYGLAVAILFNGAAFGLLHFPNHGADVWMMLPYYIAVSAVYSGLTWAADSILPALVLHSGGDVWSLVRLWASGRPEWQMQPDSAGLVWQTGVDAGFLITMAAFVGLSALTVWAYTGVHSLRRMQLKKTGL
jgi:membrane protease YdiL (CAAX protease family)